MVNKEIKVLEDSISQRDADESHKRRELILGYKKLGGALFIRLGKALFLSEQKKDFEKLGFESWKSLVSAPEESGGYSLTYKLADKLKRVYQHYVKGGIATLRSLENIAEPFKLYEAIKFINSQEEWERILLPLSEIKKLDKNIDETTCQHEWFPCWKCRKCGTITYQSPSKK